MVYQFIFSFTPPLMCILISSFIQYKYGSKKRILGDIYFLTGMYLLWYIFRYIMGYMDVYEFGISVLGLVCILGGALLYMKKIFRMKIEKR